MGNIEGKRIDFEKLFRLAVGIGNSNQTPEAAKFTDKEREQASLYDFPQTGFAEIKHQKEQGKPAK